MDFLITKDTKTRIETVDTIDPSLHVNCLIEDNGKEIIVLEEEPLLYTGFFFKEAVQTISYLCERCDTVFPCNEKELIQFVSLLPSDLKGDIDDLLCFLQNKNKPMHEYVVEKTREKILQKERFSLLSYAKENNTYTLRFFVKGLEQEGVEVKWYSYDNLKIDFLYGLKTTGHLQSHHSRLLERLLLTRAFEEENWQAEFHSFIKESKTLRLHFLF